METMQIDILNPKAVKLLQDLADMDLIAIRNTRDDDFLNIVNKIKNGVTDTPPSLDEIIAEIKSVRADRYANSKR